MESSALASPLAPSFAPKLFTGVEIIDRVWGGLYRGGAYLIYGRAASGRDLVTLRFTQTGAEHGESCLYVSPIRPRDLMIQAASIGFNLRQAYEDGTVKLMRIPASLTDDEGDEDEALLRSLRDLVAFVRQNRPERLIINDFMPFVQFRSEARFRTAFAELLEHTDVLNMTTLLVMSEPANAQSKKVVDFMSEQMTGTIHLEMPENDADSPKRRLTFAPRLGHARKRSVELWDVNDLLDEPEAGYPVRPEPPQIEAVVETVIAPTSEALSESATRGIRLGRTLADLNEASMPTPVALADEPRALPPFVVDPPPATTPFVATMGAMDEMPRWADTPTPIVTPVILPETPRIPPAPEVALLDPRLDRDAFGLRLQQHFDLHAQNGTPFLLVAMRLDRSAAALHALTFDVVADVVSDALRPADDLLVDPASERLVVLLPGSDEGAFNAFITRVKQRLREDAPEQAEDLLRAISAIAVANGRMFGTAEEFLAYALDKH
ncbi:MAG: hypothetical protein LCH53_00495 [Bacteroidetes bacterium]|nr:hypothetical protein [Bacteroidota bacterium]